MGIIGAGQLGQMLGIAAKNLGVNCVFLDPSESPPAASVGEVLRFAFDDPVGLAQLIARSDVITYEFENVPVTALESIQGEFDVKPPLRALRVAQDRLTEKTLFTSLDIPVPAFRTVDNEDDMHAACKDIGLPIVLKTRRLGYDGKGQTIVRKTSEIASAVTGLGGRDLIAEEFVEFDREVSAIGVRTAAGEIAYYALTENKHVNGILNTSKAPADTVHLDEPARSYLRSLLQHLDYVGVLALELFVCKNGLLANEFAPRVHNSGHWTIEGATTSQFENHIRAVLGLQPGSTATRGFAGMINLIGNIPELKDDIQTRECHVHDYGKKPRPGRKLGHVTVVSADLATRDSLLDQLGKLLIN